MKKAIDIVRIIIALILFAIWSLLKFADKHLGIFSLEGWLAGALVFASIAAMAVVLYGFVAFWVILANIML